MKINRNYCDPEALTLGDIKHVHPFLFPEGSSLGCDPARIYIKIYPCNNITVHGDRCKDAIGSDDSTYALVTDLEQGGIKSVAKNHRVIELDYEFNVKGPVEPRQGLRR